MALSSIGSFFLRTGVICGATILTNKYLASFVICTGPSMEPTLHTGDILITSEISPRLGLIQKGDIVIAKSPEKERIRVCKRVTAKSGDTVVNNRGRIVKVPEGHVWLEGDNKKNSNDSRFYGPVPEDLICSKCLVRVWPDLNLSALSKNPKTDITKLIK